MNEKLEQEIELWKHKRCSYDERGDISATAQHFYNLALEGVRKEMERIRTNIYDCAKICPAERQLGAAMALDDIENFIDNQKQ